MPFRVEVLEPPATFEVAEGEALLAAAARSGVKLPHACTLGGCGTCRIKVAEGRVSYDDWPMALSHEEAEQGYALACQARAASDLVLDVPRLALTPPQRTSAMVTDIQPYCHDVTHLTLVLPDLDALVYAPGQHMNIHLGDGAVRPFSMASVPNANQVDFHVRRIPGGRFTETHLAQMQPGDMLDVEIPLGTFRYHAEDYRELVMLATGTGLSPIKSILESLMDDPDCPPVSLYWGGRSEADLYLAREIGEWAQRLYEFRYVPVLSRPPDAWTGRRGHVQQAVLEDFADLSEHSLYLCGSPRMIADAKHAVLGRGASVDHIYVDGFNIQAHAA